MRPVACALILAAFPALAQWQVPLPVVLDGSDPGQRQVIGLADPAVPEAGVSVVAGRANATRYAEASGTLVLTASLFPAPAGYSTGMVVTLIPSEANLAGAEIDLNGLGPMPVVKLGGVPLDSADLAVGVPHRFVFDGTSFQLLGSAYRPCPAGYSIGGREYCIADSSQAALPFIDAGSACFNANARLCTWSEWTHACLSKPGFIGSIVDYEWVDHAANNTSNAKRVGRGDDGSAGTDLGIGCIHGNHTLPTNPVRFRCCTSR
jgi:hypothetical protein